MMGRERKEKEKEVMALWLAPLPALSSSIPCSITCMAHSEVVLYLILD